MDSRQGQGEVVPFGSAYQLHHQLAQEALKHASIVLLDHATMALAELHLNSELATVYSEQVSDRVSRDYLLRCSQGDPTQDSAVGDLPDIYCERYRTYDFLKKWIVTIALVGSKLAQPKARPLSNVAEELALHLIIQDAIAVLEMFTSDQTAEAAASEALRNLYEDAYEDNDFMELYELEDSDEIADLDSQGLLGMTDIRFKHWFLPFGSGADRGVVHPFLLDSDDRR